MSEQSCAPDLGSKRGFEGPSDLFAAAVRGSRTAMLITDPRRDDNPIVFVNDAFVALTGFSWDEAVGRNCRFLQGPETDRDAVARIRWAVEAGEGVEADILNYRRDGASFWNALAISPVRDGTGQTIAFFASLHDVTDKKQAEIDLVRARDRLEQDVERRTHDLRTTLDQMATLLHEVDHRVKNNLQVLVSLLLLKARRVRSKDAQRTLYDMAERIGALSTAHRLLHSAGDASRFDIGAFASELSRDLVSALGNGRVALGVETQPAWVPAATAASIALLLNELVSSALKYAFPDGRKGRLGVRVERLDHAVRIVVEDDGVGPESNLPGASFARSLVDMLVRQLKADLELGDGKPGARAVVVLPLDASDRP